jgi:hypothetical protein
MTLPPQPGTSHTLLQHPLAHTHWLLHQWQKLYLSQQWS